MGMKALDWFEEGLLTARGMLMSFAMNLYRDRARAEDAVQDTFCRALTNRDKFEPGTNLPAWLLVIMRNAFRANRRSAGERLVVYHDDPRYADHVPDPGNPERALLAVETLEVISRLKPHHRAALIAVGVGEQYDEIAVRTGVGVNTVKTRVRRARRNLEKMMEAA